MHFQDADRVSHKIKGLGTITHNPQADDVVVSDREEARSHGGTVYVTWDDDRFPVSAVPVEELEKVPDASAAISTGF